MESAGDICTGKGVMSDRRMKELARKGYPKGLPEVRERPTVTRLSSRLAASRLVTGIAAGALAFSGSRLRVPRAHVIRGDARVLAADVGRVPVGPRIDVYGGCTR